MEVIRAADYRRMRWKNGLGETAEIAIAPPGATLEHFAWRVSMARVEAAGPFSAFAGIDRTLTVLDGAGFRLAVDGHEAVELTPASPPYSFAGDRSATATLLGDAVTDLNVMTRRGQWWHRVHALAPGKRASIRAATALVVCAGAALRVTAAGRSVGLGALDTLLLREPPADIVADAAPSGRLLLVEIGPR